MWRAPEREREVSPCLRPHPFQRPRLKPARAHAPPLPPPAERAERPVRGNGGGAGRAEYVPNFRVIEAGRAGIYSSGAVSSRLRVPLSKGRHYSRPVPARALTAGHRRWWGEKRRGELLSGGARPVSRSGCRCGPGTGRRRAPRRSRSVVGVGSSSIHASSCGTGTPAHRHTGTPAHRQFRHVAAACHGHDDVGPGPTARSSAECRTCT